LSTAAHLLPVVTLRSFLLNINDFGRYREVTSSTKAGRRGKDCRTPPSLTDHSYNGEFALILNIKDPS